MFILEILHQRIGNSKFLRVYEMDTAPPFYPEGTSISVDDTCYVVMDTLVSFAEVDGVEKITHQVRVR